MPDGDHGDQGDDRDLRVTLRAIVQLCNVAENAAAEDASLHAQSIVLLAQAGAQSQGGSQAFGLMIFSNIDTRSLDHVVSNNALVLSLVQS